MLLGLVMWVFTYFCLHLCMCTIGMPLSMCPWKRCLVHGTEITGVLSHLQPAGVFNEVKRLLGIQCFSKL